MPAIRAEGAAVRVARVAERQWGVATRAQLRSAGLSETGVGRWVEAGRIHKIHRGVYAVGHRSLAVEGRLAAALLYAGPGAMLSHTTAARWWGLVQKTPRLVHASAPGRRPSPAGVRLHHPRRLEGARHNRMPVTTVERTLLDLASMLPFHELRRAIAEAEYRGLLDVERLEEMVGAGRPGSALLRSALARHQPRLAHTLSALEERFVALCEDARIPLPQINVTVAGLMVDALWQEQRVIVELDGHAAHGTPAAAERDRRRELTLRGAGYRVQRYTWQQITEQSELVASDLCLALGR